MITEDLVSYIKSQLEKNVSKDIIFSELSGVGWRNSDIEEGFLSVEKTIIDPTPSVSTVDISTAKEETEKKVDLYREMPEENIVESPKAYVAPVVEGALFNNTSDATEKVEEKVKPAKIWTPTTVQAKVVEIEPVIEVKKPEPEPEPEQKQEQEKEEEIVFSKETTIEPYRLEVKAEEQEITTSQGEELLPSINKNRFEISTLDVPSKPRLINVKPETAPVVERKMSDMIQKNAMIASYSHDVQEVLAAKKEEEEIAVPRKKKSFIKIGIIIFVVSLIAGMIFAFVEGYIKIPWSNINLNIVKKDPKTIMLHTPLNISKLKSYKVETNISISSPSLSNITTGLSSGDAVTSKDRDFVSIKVSGSVNNVDSKQAHNYLLDFESSILENDIKSNLKYNGEDLYVSVPDLNTVLGDNAPDPATVSLKLNQIDLVVPEFSPEVQNKIKELDIYNIISGEIPLYVKNQVASILEEFISKLEYVKKEDEKIRGVDTYHYQLISDHASTKKLLTDLSNLFIIKITQEQRKNLDEAIGASSVGSFDVWIGQNNDNLYQIKFTLNTPLSRVLNLNDSGIADNEVKLDWTTTFYDIDTPNDITLPNTEVNMDEFIKNIKNKKIKNIISSFKPETIMFKNAVGSFGSKSNPTGSCINPNPGSIFSPKGHVKGADGSVSSISATMNSLLSVTNGALSCYSTSKAWALSAPLFTTTDGLTSNFYCADSTGSVTTLQAPITGPVCK